MSRTLCEYKLKNNASRSKLGRLLDRLVKPTLGLQSIGEELVKNYKLKRPFSDKTCLSLAGANRQR